MKQLRREWAIKFQDGSVSKVRFNGRTAEERAREEAERLRLKYHPDNIRVVSRPIYAGAWEEDGKPFNLPLHRTAAGYPYCGTCDGGGCPDCTDDAYSL